MTPRVLFEPARDFTNLDSSCACGPGCACDSPRSPGGLGLLTYIIDAAAHKEGDTQTWTQKNITGNVFGLLDKFTGKTAADQARSQALQAQQAQADADILAGEERAATIRRVAPWVAVGVGVMGIVVVLGVVARSKKG